MMLNSAENLLKNVTRALKETIEDEKERAIKNAVKDFEEDLRTRLAFFTLETASYYSVQMDGPALLIRVEQVPDPGAREY